MSDDSLFREIDEEVRRDKIVSIWTRFGNLILAVCFLVIAGVGGYKAWQYWDAKQAEEAGMRWYGAVRLAEQGKDAEADKAFNDMLANMCHGGKIAMLGIPEKKMAIDWNEVIFKMLTIKGVYGREMYETWYKMSVMIESGLDLTPVITHRLHFTEFQQGFDAMREGEASKVILNWA